MKFRIVTPCYNSAPYLDATIMSVVTQAGDFELDYHVQDGGSTDGSLARLEYWAKLLGSGDFPMQCRALRFSYSSERDAGMYDAINRGFARLDADGGDAWMSWINCSDMLLPNALQTVAAVDRTFPDVRWLCGRSLVIDTDGSQMQINWLAAYARRSIADGLHDGGHMGYVQQEGTCWKAELWRAAGGKVRSDLRAAGDFELWTRFAALAELHVIDGVLGAFRFHPGQLSAAARVYEGEVAQILGPEGIQRRDAAWLDYRLALDAGDIGALHDGRFTGPILSYQFRDAERKRSYRLPVPISQLSEGRRPSDGQRIFERAHELIEHLKAFDRLIVYGVGTAASVLAPALLDRIGFFVDGKAGLQGHTFLGRPIHPPETVFDHPDHVILVTPIDRKAALQRRLEGFTGTVVYLDDYL